MSMDVSKLIDKLELESTKNHVAYDVGKYYLEAFEKEDFQAVTLYDHNLKVETQEFYHQPKNEETPPLTQSIHDFCEKYQFEGVESVKNRSIPMIDPVMLEYNVEKSKENARTSYDTEKEFEDSSTPAYAVYRLKENDFNEQLYQIDLASLEKLKEVPDKGNYQCIYTDNLENLMVDCFEVKDKTPENFNDEFESAIYNNILLDQQFVWNYNELLDGDVIALQYDGEISYFFNDVEGLEVIDFEVQPTKLMLRSDEIKTPTMVDLNTLTSETFQELMGNNENLENIVRDVIPILQSKDEIMVEFEEIDSDILYKDFTILESEVAVVNEVALLTNENKDVYVVADRGAFANEGDDTFQWSFPEVFTSHEQAKNSFEMRVDGLTEMNKEIAEYLENEEQVTDKSDSLDISSEPVVASTVVAVSSMELLDMMIQDSEFADKVGEARDFLNISEMLDQTHSENDLRVINDLADSMLSSENIDKIYTLKLVTTALNTTELNLEDIKMVELSDIHNCIGNSSDVSMLKDYVDTAYKLQSLQIDNSPEAHSEIQSFFEEPIPTADLEKFRELVEKTGIISDENSKDSVFEYLIGEIADEYITTADLHYLTPEDVDKAMNSHIAYVQNDSLRLHAVVFKNQEAEKTATMEQMPVDYEDVVDKVVYQVGDNYVLFENEDNKVKHSVYDENFVLRGNGGFSSESITQEIELFLAAYSLEDMEQLESHTAPIVDTNEFLSNVIEQRLNPIETSEQALGFFVVDKEMVENTEIFLGENAFGQFATFSREATEDGSGKWEYLHFFSGEDYQTNHQRADEDFNQRVEFRMPVEQARENLTFDGITKETQGQINDVVDMSEDNYIMFTTFTNQERVVIETATNYAYDNLTDYSNDDKSIMADILCNIDTEDNLSNFYPEKFTFEVNDELLENGNKFFSSKELDMISKVCQGMNNSMEELPDSYREVLETIVTKIDYYQTELVEEVDKETIIEKADTPRSEAEPKEVENEQAIENKADFNWKSVDVEQLTKEMSENQDLKRTVILASELSMVASVLENPHSVEELSKINDFATDIYLKYDDVSKVDISDFIGTAINNGDIEVSDLDTLTRSQVFSAFNERNTDELATLVEEKAVGDVSKNLDKSATESPRIVADTYTITDSEVVGDFEIALGESQEGMFATWSRCVSADESKGFEADWNAGHYHMVDKESAIADFQQRVGDKKTTKEAELGDKVSKKEKEEPKKSILESLKQIKAETEQKDSLKLPTKDKSDQSL